MTAVLSRRSHQVLAEPAPGVEEFAYLLKAAACAPDHGRLRPWRWVLFRGDDRDAVAAALAEGGGGSVETARAKARRAPLLAGLVMEPRLDSAIPEWEQLAAVTAMTTTLMLLLHARGFGSIWRTGRLLDSPPVRKLLGLNDHERALGWLYVGTPDPDQGVRRRERPDVAERLAVFDARRQTAT